MTSASRSLALLDDCNNDKESTNKSINDSVMAIGMNRNHLEAFSNKNRWV